MAFVPTIIISLDCCERPWTTSVSVGVKWKPNFPWRVSVFSEVDTENHFPGFRKRHDMDTGCLSKTSFQSSGLTFEADHLPPHVSSSSNALACLKSVVSNPSVNQ